MREIELTNHGFKVLVDDEDWLRCSMFNWNAAGGKSYTTIRRTAMPQIPLANFIMKDHVSVFDHIDRDFKNFSKTNLRRSTKSQNEANKPKQDRFKPCSSQYKGVNWLAKNKKWMAKISVNKKQMYLGSFTLEIDAAKAYNSAAQKYFGEFACLNEVV